VCAFVCRVYVYACETVTGCFFGTCVRVRACMFLCLCLVPVSRVRARTFVGQCLHLLCGCVWLGHEVVE